MKWQNHIIGASFGAVINPVVIPVTVLGSTAPDWMEYILKILGYKVKHRGVTHVCLYWVAAILCFWLIADYHHIGLGFSIGGFSHVIADSFTIAGVPFSPSCVCVQVGFIYHRPVLKICPPLKRQVSCHFFTTGNTNMTAGWLMVQSGVKTV